MNKKLKTNTFYNTKGEKSSVERMIIGGNPTGFKDYDDIKYHWTESLRKRMQGNTWFPSEVDTSKDKYDYLNKLNDKERDAFDKALSQLIFMDSLQTESVSRLIPFITAPEIQGLLVRQDFEEDLHTESYFVLIRDISVNKDKIKELWRTNEHLMKKNEKLAKVYNDFFDNPTEENFVKMLFANQILEGIYFYSGFTYIYSLGFYKNAMPGAVEMIRFINRDENTHLELFRNIINSLYDERPDLFTEKLKLEVVQMFKEAVELETDWGVYIGEGGLLGMTKTKISEFNKYRANQILYGVRKVGIPKIYAEVKNPFEWVNAYSTPNSAKQNFFETTVTDYSKGSIEMDF